VTPSVFGLRGLAPSSSSQEQSGGERTDASCRTGEGEALTPGRRWRDRVGTSWEGTTDQALARTEQGTPRAAACISSYELALQGSLASEGSRLRWRNTNNMMGASSPSSASSSTSTSTSRPKLWTIPPILLYRSVIYSPVVACFLAVCLRDLCLLPSTLVHTLVLAYLFLLSEATLVLASASSSSTLPPSLLLSHRLPRHGPRQVRPFPDPPRSRRTRFTLVDIL
jgi:hypothetical protein